MCRNTRPGERSKAVAAPIDPQKVADLIVEAADTLIVPRFRQLQQGEISTKSGPNDLVTIADRETEAWLDETLTKLYPQTVLIGEESISEGVKSLETLKEVDKLIWVADPVDGTHNFVNGKREFGVMLAAVYNNEIVHGWIYDVIGRSMLIAHKGGGAWLDGQRLKTAAPKPLKELHGYAGFSYLPEKMRPHFKQQKDNVASISSLKCAAHEYLNLASGKADFGIYSRVKAWDHLAGSLAVQESGGRVRLWDGQDYYPSFSGHGLVAASSMEVEAEIRAAFLDPFTSPEPMP
jgi:fructose-1,6-bisphosphatase/inositol monophosphatase family enzyme